MRSFPPAPVNFHIGIFKKSFTNKTNVLHGGFFIHKARPLQWRKWLRNQDADADRDLSPSQILATDLHQVFDKHTEGFHVFERFCGEPDHGVELDLVEAAPESMFSRIVHVFIADGLVDHLAEAFRARLWGKGRTAAALERRHFPCKRLPETADTNARK